MAFGLDDAIGGIASIGAGLFGKSEQDKARDAAREAYEKSVADLEAIGVPSIEAQQLVMERYKSEGEWTPELEEAVKMGDSNMLGVSTDPAYKEASMKALSRLSDIGKDGSTLEDKANLERTMGDINAEERGSREAILQKTREQGGYGSGSALAAQLMNQQGSSARAHDAGLNTAATAEKRALEAIIAGGELGGKLRSQEFSEKSDVAKAQDTIAAWNAANSQDVRGRNANVANTAAQWNLNNKQNLSNSNVDTSNKEQTYNKGLQQQKYANELEIAKAKAAARAGQAQNATAAGNASAQMWAGIGSGINKAIAGSGSNDGAPTAAASTKMAALPAWMQNNGTPTDSEDAFRKAHGMA